MQSLRALKGLLWFIAVFQFVVGALLLLMPNFVPLMVGLYGGEVEFSDQFSFILKILGAYMLMTGMIASGAARARVPHPAIVTALVVLFVINALYRITRFDHIQSIFSIAGWLLIVQIVVLSGLAFGLVALSRAAMKSSGNAARDVEG